ncbi:depupylase/deamidase Dop [Sinomonas sp. ASV486]|uniref:depupylase/deamidase Dop n=1 Tax=Sinomonas sp. ASV486 TaxID=3051170 RepID=UPI0027DAD83F|nr:depupylase/deamidase Dop [Sinomonas sp. ASV486]MDQ4491374.1 depupylase/deamidase Dop [Sinomonas sp. ASV486]
MASDTSPGLAVGGAQRVMGAETEFGIHAPNSPGANATYLSSQVIAAYARLSRARPADPGTSWDYTDETPLRDARGWAVPRGRAHEDQLTDVEPILTAEAVALAHGPAEIELDGDQEPALMNLVLGNGARLYVDHAHPEYSSPEVTNPRDAVIWDLAGDAVALAAVRALADDAGRGPINLYKNNTDGKGASYGTHENYLVPRAVPFSDLVSGLTPFFISRQLICGSGRVGLGQDGSGPGYQISQRADYFEAEVGLETTMRRPIINTRDEPHAVADKYRRLHVIVGDANVSHVANYLKFGTAALVLSLVEAGRAPQIEVHEPVEAMHRLSHDTDLVEKVRLLDGRYVTGLELQWIYFEAAAKLAADTGVASADGGDGHTAHVLARWEQSLNDLAGDRDAAAGYIEWLAKLRVLDGYRSRDGLSWGDARLGLVDIQWSDVRPERGIALRLAARGSLETMADAASVAAAVSEPPADTRAWFRGTSIKRFPGSVASASWDSVVFAPPGSYRLQRVPTREPLRGTKALTQGLFDEHAKIEDFLTALLGERRT